MRYHPVDVFILLVAVIGIAAIFIIDVQTISPKGKQSSKPELDVECWTPPEWTDSHIKYGNQVCRTMLVKGEVWGVDSSPVPSDPQRESLFKFNLQDWVDKKMDVKPSGLRGSLAVQLIVAVVGFLILTEVLTMLQFRSAISRLHSSSSGDNTDVSSDLQLQEKPPLGGAEGQPLDGGSGNTQKSMAGLKLVANSCLISILYGVLLFILSIVWFILAAKSAAAVSEGSQGLAMNETSAMSQDKSNIFLCDLEIRKLGNVQQYTIQCAFSVDTPGVGKSVRKSPNHQTSMGEMNSCLCFTVAGLLLLHFLHTSILAPILNKGFLPDSISKSLGMSGIKSIFSDLNLLLSLGKQ